MNAAQLTAFRDLWASATAEPVDRPETMTAHAMADVPHYLSQKACFATLTDGTRYVWHETLQLWVRY